MIQLAFVGEKIHCGIVCNVNEIPNKVGGRPIWLNPTQPLQSVECFRCEKQMPLLLQIYAPEDYPVNAFHRILYVFCCKNGTCRYFKVFRSQLELKNNIYTMDGDLKVKQEKDCVEVEGKVTGYCAICGLLANQVCGKCHSRRYCSREHQQLDWTHGHHKQFCGTDKETPELVQEWISCFRFPELELEEEQEPEKSFETVSDEIGKTLHIKEEGDDDLAHEDETETEVDKQFLKFQKRTSRAPDQVLRYGRTGVDNEEPLWVSDIGKDVQIDPCPHCKAQRTFEFQITPQLLAFLELDNKNKDSLDWGTLLVFSCSAHCEAANQRCVEEVVHCQQFSSQGMGDAMRKKLQDRENGIPEETEE